MPALIRVEFKPEGKKVIHARVIRELSSIITSEFASRNYPTPNQLNQFQSAGAKRQYLILQHWYWNNDQYIAQHYCHKKSARWYLYDVILSTRTQHLKIRQVQCEEDDTSELREACNELICELLPVLKKVSNLKVRSTIIDFTTSRDKPTGVVGTAEGDWKIRRNFKQATNVFSWPALVPLEILILTLWWNKWDIHAESVQTTGAMTAAYISLFLIYFLYKVLSTHGKWEVDYSVKTR